MSTVVVQRAMVLRIAQSIVPLQSVLSARNAEAAAAKSAAIRSANTAAPAAAAAT